MWRGKKKKIMRENEKILILKTQKVKIVRVLKSSCKNITYIVEQNENKEDQGMLKHVTDIKEGNS